MDHFSSKTPPFDDPLAETLEIFRLQQELKREKQRAKADRAWELEMATAKAECSAQTSPESVVKTEAEDDSGVKIEIEDKDDPFTVSSVEQVRADLAAIFGKETGSVDKHESEDMNAKNAGLANAGADDKTGRKPEDASSVNMDSEKSGAVKVPAKKKSKYGVELGVTPYPDSERPTQEECQKVFDILKSTHGTEKSKPPEDFAIPSRTVAGCGNVKFLLEALIRTLLSAHTSFSNANKAWTDLAAVFPHLTEGSCKNFLDWDAVRKAPVKDLENAIRRGGMAPTKSKNIKTILDIVFEENDFLRKTWETRQSGKAGNETKESYSKEVTLSKGTLKEGESRKASIDIEHPLEILEKAEQSDDNDDKTVAMAKFFKNTLFNEPNVLTLDYIHAMDDAKAFNKMTELPGIGVKTAACVMLFSKQRPFFAVDTHVHRICRWLGWTPKNASRDAVFAHVNVRCPDDLKYGLHQLMIEHGKMCPKCKKNPGVGEEQSLATEVSGDKKGKKGGKKNLQDIVCPLEDLLDRFDQTLTRKRKRSEDDEAASDGDNEAETETSGPSKRRATKTAKTEAASTTRTSPRNAAKKPAGKKATVKKAPTKKAPAKKTPTKKATTTSKAKGKAGKKSTDSGDVEDTGSGNDDTALETSEMEVDETGSEYHE